MSISFPPNYLMDSHSVLNTASMHNSIIYSQCRVHCGIFNQPDDVFIQFCINKSTQSRDYSIHFIENDGQSEFQTNFSTWSLLTAHYIDWNILYTTVSFKSRMSNFSKRIMIPANIISIFTQNSVFKEPNNIHPLTTPTILANSPSTGSLLIGYLSMLGKIRSQEPRNFAIGQ